MIQRACLIPDKKIRRLSTGWLFFPTQILGYHQLRAMALSRNRDFFQTFLTFKQNSLQWKGHNREPYNSEKQIQRQKNKGCLCFFSFHSVSCCTSQVSSQGKDPGIQNAIVCSWGSCSSNFWLLLHSACFFSTWPI